MSRSDQRVRMRHRHAGNYLIISSLNASSAGGDCISVEAPDVELDLGGVAITGPGLDSLPNTTGVHLTKKARNAIVVGNGARITGLSFGVVIEAEGASVGGFAATQDSTGVYVSFAKRCRVYDFDASGRDVGVQLVHSSGVALENFTANDTGSDGLYLFGSSESRILSFQTNSNRGEGVFLEAGGCFAGNCREALALRNQVIGGTANENGYAGIMVVSFTNLVQPNSGDDQFIGNTAIGNSVIDLSDGNPGCDHNLWFGNTFMTTDPPCIR